MFGVWAIKFYCICMSHNKKHLNPVDCEEWDLNVARQIDFNVPLKIDHPSCVCGAEKNKPFARNFQNLHRNLMDDLLYSC